MPSPPLLPVASLLVNALIWGVSWIPFRHLDKLGMHSLWTTAWIYSVCALAVLLRHRDAAGQLLRSRPLLVLALAAGTTNVCFNWGVTVGEVVRVVLLFYLMPVWSALLARLVLGESITTMTVVRVLLAVSGAAAILWQPGAGLPLPASLGDWLGLTGGAAFALTNVMLRRQADDPPPARALAMFLGGILLPLSLAALMPSVSPPTIDPAIAGFATLTGLLFLVANLALQYGAARLPASVTAVVMLSEVVFATATAVAFGNEQMSVRTLAGGLMIVAASLAAAIGPRLAGRWRRAAP